MSPSLISARGALAALLATAAVLVAGCSLTTIAYNNAVPLASWYVDDYVNLNETQRELLEARLGKLLVWHRASELPAYSKVLNEAAARVNGPVDGEDVMKFYDQGGFFARRVGEYALDDIADLLLTLDAEQIRQIERKLAKDNAKFEDERLRPPRDKRAQKRLEGQIKGFESWLGSVTDEQRRYIEQAAADAPLFDELRLADRRRLQGAFIALLKEMPVKAVFKERLRVLLITPEAGRSPEYRAAVLRWRRDTPETIAWVLGRATPQQRAHLQRKLRGYSTDIAALMNAA